MKKLLCNALANAGAEHISTEDPTWRRASQLEREAASVKDLLYILQNQFNSAVEPQASVYSRIDRIHEKAVKRHMRRSIAECVAMYRSMRYTADRVSPQHVYYHQIVDALLADEEALEVAQ